jgi:Pyruvate/2-oxoacid:ferredoxin oxidoreductase gamma subunit
MQQMHPLIQQRRDVIGALMIRTRAARGEFARLVGLPLPEKKVRFQVKTVGKAYHVIDLVTDKVKAFRWTYKAAIDMAIQFEKQASRLPGGVH